MPDVQSELPQDGQEINPYPISHIEQQVFHQGAKYRGKIRAVWALVTDQTTKNILWEGRIPVPYRGDKGSSATGYSVAATPDSGFTVAGTLFLPDSLGGRNAFAAHIIPKLVPTAVRLRPDIHRAHSSDPWTIAFQSNYPGTVELCLFDVRGKRTALRSQWMSTSGRDEFRLEKSAMGEEISFWRLKLDGHTVQGLVPVIEH